MNRINAIKSLPKTDLDRKLERVKQTFVGVPVFRGKDNYPYALISLTDSIPPITPDLVEDIADLLIYYGANFGAADILVSEADRGGGPITHAVAVRTGLPYVLANWYPGEVPGIVAVETSVGFSGRGYIYLNGLASGQKAILVDDLLSTGGTAVALLEGIEKQGAVAIEALFVGEKIGLGGRQKVSSRFNLPLTSLVRFVADGNRTRLHQEAVVPADQVQTHRERKLPRDR